MREDFKIFISQLKETNFYLKDFVDFAKVEENVEKISIKLNQLNYLIGQEDMDSAVRRLWAENPKVFSVLDILIAVRRKDKKKVIDINENIRLVNDFFNTPDQVIVFLNETGLTKVLKNKKIKNLVDYVFGVEVGLDSNARKNRGGRLMERYLAKLFKDNGITFRDEVYYNEFPEIVRALGKDKKRFDFVIKTLEKTYLIETNFYTGGGSKPNEVARAYSELAPKINSVPGFEFIWITDGTGWKKAINKLEEAFSHIPSIYNLTSIDTFIKKLKTT